MNSFMKELLLFQCDYAEESMSSHDMSECYANKKDDNNVYILERKEFHHELFSAHNMVHSRELSL